MALEQKRQDGLALSNTARPRTAPMNSIENSFKTSMQLLYFSRYCFPIFVTIFFKHELEYDFSHEKRPKSVISDMSS